MRSSRVIDTLTDLGEEPLGNILYLNGLTSNVSIEVSEKKPPRRFNKTRDFGYAVTYEKSCEYPYGIRWKIYSVSVEDEAHLRAIHTKIRNQYELDIEEPEENEEVIDSEFRPVADPPEEAQPTEVQPEPEPEQLPQEHEEDQDEVIPVARPWSEYRE